MIVEELIEGLKKFDPKLEVIMPKDPEGNGYHAACMPSGAHCLELGSHYIEEIIHEDYFDEYEEYGLEEEPKVNCVVL